MANVLKHTKVSAVGDGGDTSLVRPGDWNAQHVFAGGSDGKVLTWDDAESDKVKFVTPAATVDSISSVYPVFTPSGDDDEFDNASFTGWTAVNSGSNTVVVTETNHVASLAHPGGDGVGGELHAWMKSRTVNTNDWVEMCFRGMGTGQSYNLAGLLFADGTSYGAGAQIGFIFYNSVPQLSIQPWTNYNSVSALFNVLFPNGVGDLFLRFKYEGSNHWRGYASADGISFVDVTGQVTSTLTPTKAGFCVSTRGGTGAFNWSIRYVKFGNG